MIKINRQNDFRRSFDRSQLPLLAVFACSISATMNNNRMPTTTRHTVRFISSFASSYSRNSPKIVFTQSLTILIDMC